MYSSLNIQVNVFLSLNIIPNPFYFNKQEKNNTRIFFLTATLQKLYFYYKFKHVCCCSSAAVKHAKLTLINFSFTCSCSQTLRALTFFSDAALQ